MKSLTKITKLIFTSLFVVATFSCSTLNARRLTDKTNKTDTTGQTTLKLLVHNYSQLPPGIQKLIITYLNFA